MKMPFDPGFPRPEEDHFYLSQIRDVVARPVFIMGLHRSGTTFLYDSVARCFPMANLSLYHLFYYHRLLKNHAEGGEARDRQTLNQLFRRMGITDRKLDSVYVDDRMVEEYGWMLRNHSYSMKVTERNRTVLDEMCRKLQYVTPGAQAVLLKNPWDTGNARQILNWFPNARFIYITRDPIYILNSQMNAMLSLLTGSQPFQTLLVDNFKMPFGKRSLQGLYAGWKAVRGVKALTGNRPFETVLRPFIAAAVGHELNNYYSDLEALPPESVYALNYQSFNDRPQEHLQELAEFLNLPFVTPPEAIIPHPRKGHLKPHLQDYEAHFMQKLKRRIPQLAGQNQA
jgi:hypothetical protein